MTSATEIVRTLGVSTIDSPLRIRRHGNDRAPTFADDAARVRMDVMVPERQGMTFELAGPRSRIFFDPRAVTVGILTAGGLCPGIDDVIRSAVLELIHGYGVRRILGFRYGYRGLDPKTAQPPMLLGLEEVRDIHLRGGTILGTSRGPHDPEAMAATLAAHGVDVLLVIGGDGTMRAAHAIHGALLGARIGIVGIPKTIDNDIPFVDKTFGFETAVAAARLVIDAAHAEARSVERGIGLVKVMGRNAGFIAAHATLASAEVNACLVPEVPFRTDALLSWLEDRLAERDHAVIVVAEGCAENAGVDDSGNRRFTSSDADVGRQLAKTIEQHFAGTDPVTLKYLEPSYLLRGLRASSEDAVFCDALARNAVHAAMAGKTDLIVGRWHRCFTHVPLAAVLSCKKAVDPGGELWRQVVESTGQPSF